MLNDITLLLNASKNNTFNEYTLGAVCEIKTGKGITKKDAVEGGRYPIISGGKSPMGYYNETNRKANTVTVSRVGANAGYVSFINRDFYLNDKCFSVIPLKKYERLILPEYLFEVLKAKERYISSMKSEGGVPTINTKKLSSLSIIIPSLDIQMATIRILKNFNLYVEGMQKERDLRLEQYKWCKRILFNKENEDTKVKLLDCCRLEKGKTPIQKAVPGDYPLVVTTSERKSSKEYQFKEPSVCVPLVSSRGHGIACLNQVYYQEGLYAVGNILCAVVPNDTKILNTKYLYYYLNHYKDELIVPLMKGGANVSLTVEALKTVKIDIPSMNRQMEIVSVLQVFDEFFQNYECESKKRESQYQYYRDKLLSLDIGM